MPGDLRAEVTQFFDAFVEAFATFDGTIVAERYAPAFIAVHADGSLHNFTASVDIARYFQRFLDGYYADGCRSCGYHALEVVPIGEACVLATVTWELFDGSHTLVSTWRESYNLARQPSGLQVFASMDHAG